MRIWRKKEKKQQQKNRAKKKKRQRLQERNLCGVDTADCVTFVKGASATPGAGVSS